MRQTGSTSTCSRRLISNCRDQIATACGTFCNHVSERNDLDPIHPRSNLRYEFTTQDLARPRVCADARSDVDGSAEEITPAFDGKASVDP